MRFQAAILFFILILVNPLAARTWHVPDEVATIQAAIDPAEAYDVVEIACGTYFEHGIVMKDGVTVRSETGLPDCVTIDAQQLDRVFLCTDLHQNANFIGLTITGGSVPDEPGYYGGGIRCISSTVSISNCDLVDNYAGFAGGGIHANGSSLNITDCRFIGNEAYMAGGGLYFNDSGREIANCWFEANASIDGAGFFCQSSSPSLESCTFLNNDGFVFGGAVFCHIDASPSFRNCSLVGNEANAGAGIMTAHRSYPTMENCVIAYNRDGAGVYCYDGTSVENYVYLDCSDVFGNEGGNYTGRIDDQTGLNGNISEDPVFCDMEAGDITLTDGSPCLPDGNDCSVLMGSLEQGCTITSVDNAGILSDLSPNFPNPFNPGTAISFALDRMQHVTLAVFDIQGRRVTVLADRNFTAGNHAEPWDGRDDSGLAVSSGTYLIQLETEDGLGTGKVVLVR